MTMTRVTVTLPAELVEEIDRLEANRSRFVAAGVRREIEHRWREALELSLRRAHEEGADLAEEGFSAWAEALPQDDVEGLVDTRSGTAVRWVQERGWVEGDE